MSDTLTPVQELHAPLPSSHVSLGEAALAYARRGWHVFPLKPRDKPPLINGGFHKATTSVEQIEAWWAGRPDANIGLAPAASGLVVFDIDSAPAEEVARSLGLLDLPTLTVHTGRATFSGRHLYFSSSDTRLGNLRLGLANSRLVRASGRIPALEVKADAGYVVAPPSIHPSGSKYAFEEPGCQPASLPPGVLAAIQAVTEHRTTQSNRGAAAGGDESHASELEEVPTSVALTAPREGGVTLEDARRWLDALAPERHEDYHNWLGVLMALHHQFAGTPDEGAAVTLAIEWSMQSAKYQPGAVEEKWRSFASSGRPEITIRSLRRWAAEDSSQRQGYPVIDCTVSSEATLTVPTWRAIDERNKPEPRTYWSNGNLAGLRPRADDTLYIAPFTLETLPQHLAAHIANFERRNRKGFLTPCYPPLSLIKHLLANPAPPVELPKLRRVVPVPIFAANGELITTPGYHKASRTFYAPPPWLGALQPVPERPDAAHVQTAIRIFDEHIGCNFPFDNDGGASRAHALSLALQGFVIDVIDQITPLFDVEAAQRRTGKGLLSECCLMPAFGPALAAKRMPMPKSDEEMIKVLTALFREGGLLIAFDNVKGPVEFASLEAALTAESFEGRVLGSSTLIQAVNRATFVMISNNPEMSGDLAGRSIRIRLISPVEFPEDRTDFTRLQPTYTRQHLPELIWALQTIVANWFALGCTGPAPGTPGLGSYPRWRQVIGGIVHAAEVEGFLRNRGALRREVSRPEMQWRDFVYAWRERYGDRPVPTSDLVRLAEEHDIPLAGENDRARATALGMRLAKSVGIRYFDRFTVERSKSGGDRLWGLVDHGISGFEDVPVGAFEQVLGIEALT